MSKLILGNWKCHKTSEDGKNWLEQFAARYRPHSDLEVSISPNLLSLEVLADYCSNLKLANFSMAAQDVSPFPRGAYTGTVAADMLKKMVKYVVVGHSERRRYFHETIQDVINKVTEVADAGLVPVVCVEDDNFLSRLSPIADIECEALIVAYTPMDAVNFRISESVDRVTKMTGGIRSYFPDSTIIYGGSVIPDNVTNYLEIEGLAGLFVGAASLEVATFLEICEKVVKE